MTTNFINILCIYKYINCPETKKTAQKPCKIKALSGFSVFMRLHRKKRETGLEPSCKWL